MSDEDFIAAVIAAINNGDLKTLFQQAIEKLATARGGEGLREAMAIGVALAHSDAKNESPPPAVIEFLTHMAEAPVAPQAFKLMREQFGISQTDVAKFCGVEHPSISIWERGVEPMPAKALRGLMMAIAESKLPKAAKPKKQHIGEFVSGADLRALRKKLGMKQKDLAEALGMSVFTIQKWEEYPSKPIAASSIQRIRPQLDALREQAATAA